MATATGRRASARVSLRILLLTTMVAAPGLAVAQTTSERLLNAADDPVHCTFTVPARVRQGALLITIATGGHSPAVAKWLRQRFESEFGPEYHVLLELLSAERERIKAVGGSTEGLRWQVALDSGLLDLLRAERIAEALELLRTCLSSSSA
jgi:precorrin-2 dehydrogenase / sirohydrochlorin ferrochelatase